MNSTEGRLSSVGLHLDYKYNLCAAKSLVDHDYCKKTLVNANVLNIDPQKHTNINKIIETKYSNSEPSLGAKLDYKSRNENLVEKIVLQNRLEIIITMPVMHQGPESIPLHNEINCQINQNVEIVKIRLEFLRSTKFVRE